MAVSQSNAIVDMNFTGALLNGATKSFQLSKKYCQIFVNVSMLNILFRRSGCMNTKELKCKEIEGIEFITLKGREPEDPVLKYLMFVLKGIKNAIAKGFLREIYLLFKHPETLEPLEIYTIAVKYNPAGVKKQGIAVSSFRDTTLSVLKHISNLDKFDKLPRYTKVKVELTYNENTPANYQPPGFKEAEQPVCLNLEKQKVVIGFINTGYHKLIYSGRGNEVVKNAAAIYGQTEKTKSQDDLDDIPLSKRIRVEEETNEQADQSVVNMPSTSAYPDPPQETIDMEIEEHGITDGNRNIIDSPKSIDQVQSISLISSEESVSEIGTPVKCSLDSISCICEVDTMMFIESHIDEKEIERIACDRCKKTYHLPCHGYLTRPIMREFFCVSCTPHNTSDTILRSIEGSQIRIFSRCRLLIYLMNKYGTPQDGLLSLFSESEQSSLAEKLVRFKVKNRLNQVSVAQIQKTAHMVFNMEDSQYLF
nr:unnamed protein product [Callosobruchus chinensis]